MCDIWNNGKDKNRVRKLGSWKFPITSKDPPATIINKSYELKIGGLREYQLLPFIVIDCSRYSCGWKKILPTVYKNHWKCIHTYNRFDGKVMKLF